MQINSTSQDPSVLKKGEPLSILVLEDDSHLNRIIMHKLQDVGHKAVLATNVGDAINILQNGEHIDVLWLDVLLPGASGLELLKYIKEREEFKHIKTFVVSASGGVAQQEEAMRLGAAAYLVKGNYSLDEIIERIVAG